MQNRSEIIGGEFDVDLQSLKYSHSGNVCLDGLYKYSSGRSALYHILLDVKKRTISARSCCLITSALRL